MTTTTPASINNKTTKVKMLKEDRFIFILFYGGFFFKYTFVKPRKFFTT